MTVVIAASLPAGQIVTHIHTKMPNPLSSVKLSQTDVENENSSFDEKVPQIIPNDWLIIRGRRITWMTVVIAASLLLVKLSPYITYIHTIGARPTFRADFVVGNHPSLNLSQTDVEKGNSSFDEKVPQKITTFSIWGAAVQVWTIYFVALSIIPGSCTGKILYKQGPGNQTGPGSLDCKTVAPAIFNHPSHWNHPRAIDREGVTKPGKIWTLDNIHQPLKFGTPSFSFAFSESLLAFWTWVDPPT